MNDFLKFATAQGMNSMHVEQVMHDSMAAQPRANYISPSILEERQLNVTQMDVFSRLMMDRIIFLGTLPEHSRRLGVCRIGYIRYDAVRVVKGEHYVYGDGCLDGCRAARSRRGWYA